MKNSGIWFALVGSTLAVLALNGDARAQGGDDGRVEHTALSRVIADQKEVSVIVTMSAHYEGVIVGEDHSTILLRSKSGKERLVYKHAIAYIALSGKE